MTGMDIERIAPEALTQVAQSLQDDGGRLHMAYAWYPEDRRPEVRYIASRPERPDFFAWTTAANTSLPSIANIFPLMAWYEREITDLFGVEFTGHPDPYPLVLHAGARPALPPLDPAYPTNQIIAYEPRDTDTPDIDNADVQRLPFGPVRADVVESAEMIFFYVGEHILHYHPQLFFKHRGMEKRFEGLPLTAAVILAERVSGVGSFSHALAFCQAVERAAGCEVPIRARRLRCLFGELERLYNHLHYLGHLADTTTLKVGNAEGKLLEEQVKQINGALTGSRFLRGLLIPGGLRRDIDPGSSLTEEVEAIRKAATEYTALLERTNSYLDRLITTGPLPEQVAIDQGATGPIRRASGSLADLRVDHPYAAYDELPIKVATRRAGDAHARSQVRIEEIDSSIAAIQRVLLTLEPGPIKGECIPGAGSEGFGWAEGPRGSVFYAVHFDADAKLSRVKVKSPSFSNWRVFPFTVHDSNMMDYAINEASFGLTISGCDR